jgi:hypothetical protein
MIGLRVYEPATAPPRDAGIEIKPQAACRRLAEVRRPGSSS